MGRLLHTLSSRPRQGKAPAGFRPQDLPCLARTPWPQRTGADSGAGIVAEGTEHYPGRCLHEAPRSLGITQLQSLRTLCSHPFFIGGLLARLALIVLVAPVLVEKWYVPFFDVSTDELTLDPWAQWLAAGGNPVAYPY